jgi:hypothetical protein
MLKSSVGNQSSPGNPLRRGLHACFLLAFCSATLLHATAQQPEQGQPSQPLTVDRTLAPVHGMVRSAVTGQPLPRALVRIEGDADTGALTDGEGRFEFPGVPVGPQQFEVVKPGFVDPVFSAVGAQSGMKQFIYAMTTGAHNVLVAAEMPDLVFTLAPTGSIQGRVELSTGDPAQGIAVHLAGRTIEDGRALWQPGQTANTNSEGIYRFAGLADGPYALYTEPAMETEPATTLIETGSAATAERAGYPCVFYPDAHDQAGAEQIRLRAGEQVQANLNLTLEPFHAVSAVVSLPHGQAPPSNGAGPAFSALVLDAAGHQLPYRAQYDQKSHTIQTQLPNGTYSLLVSSIPRRPNVPTIDFGRASQDEEPQVGSVDFAVAGHPVSNLRVPLSVPRPSPMQLTFAQSATKAASGRDAQITVMAIRAGGWIDGITVNAFPNATGPGPIETQFTLPGSYWMAVHLPQGLCEASFTAGGVSLAHEPLAVPLSGSAPPLELTLRDDCARLTVSLPETLAGMTAGEEPFYTVYVVPDFDSNVDVIPLTLRPSTGGTSTLENLTPGSYHVYTFPAPVPFEYRNPAALASLPNPGQLVTLSPEASSSLALEAPER